MKYDGVYDETLHIMENYLTKGDPVLLEELYEYGEISGNLPKTTILQMWHGTSLSKFDVLELQYLFEFLNSKYNIGDIRDFFYSKNDKRKKERYLETISDETLRVVEASMLNRLTERMESIFQKDISEMTEDELIAGFSNMGYVNKRSLQNAISIARRYVNWCANEGYYAPAKEPIRKISSADIEDKKNILNAIIPHPQRLKQIIEVTKRDELQGNRSITDIIIVCLYWLGFNFEEIYNLEEKDVDLQAGIIRHAHYKEISIPDELSGYFRHYINTDIIHTGKYFLFADKTKYFIHRFIRENEKTTGERLSLSRMRSSVHSFRIQYKETTGHPLKITSKNLNVSGACWRIYSREKMGEVITDDVIKFEARLTTQPNINEFNRVYGRYKEIFYGA